MVILTCMAEISPLDDKTDTVNRDSGEPVFGSGRPVLVPFYVSAFTPRPPVDSKILFLTNQDEVVAEDGSARLPDNHLDPREALDTTTQQDTNDSNRPTGVESEGLGKFLGVPLTLRLAASPPCGSRATNGIERGPAEGANMLRMESDQDGSEGRRPEIRRILDVVNPPNSSLGTGEHVPQSLSVDPRDTATTSASENALRRLIRREFVSVELPSMLEFLAHEDVDAEIRSLPKEDAQTFVDVVDQALGIFDLSQRTRVKCTRSLFKTCNRHGLLPGAMKIPICYDRTGTPLYRGGYADVWKGEYCGREVAVKVIRTYSESDFGKIIGKFCKEVLTWKALQHPNILPLIGVTMTEAQFAMVSDWMPNGNINEFVRANPDTNRLKLLTDVAKGLAYLHSREMVHGDLKSVNILIDRTRHARLADFGLLKIVSDPANLVSPASHAQSGHTARWMSPELIAPREFGLTTSRPSKYSDCYSLGMVIYETITGTPPFYEDQDLLVFLKVLRGERPHRGVGFTGSLWEVLERSWMAQPDSRPSVESVLQCLEECSKSSELPPPGIHEGTEDLGLGGSATPDKQFHKSSPDHDTPLEDQPPGQEPDRNHSVTVGAVAGVTVDTNVTRSLTPDSRLSFDTPAADNIYPETEASFSAQQQAALLLPFHFVGVTAHPYEDTNLFGHTPPPRHASSLFSYEDQTEVLGSDTKPNRSYWFYNAGVQGIPDSDGPNAPHPTITETRQSSDPYLEVENKETTWLSARSLPLGSNDTVSRVSEKRGQVTAQDETRGTKRTRRERARHRDPEQGQIQTDSSLPTRPGFRVVQQVRYRAGISQCNWTQLPFIIFMVNGVEGIRLTDALNMDFNGPDGRDDPMFTAANVGSSVSCRINFSGYNSCKSVRQIPTRNYKRERSPITRKKLAHDVAKCIRAHLGELKDAGTPFHVHFEGMFLTKLINVSRATWQPEIWCEDSPSTNP